MQAPTSTDEAVAATRPADGDMAPRRPRRVHPAVRVHVLSLVVGWSALLWLLRGTWFRGDDFEFLANRVGPERSLSIWYPHNEHWSTGPIAIWRLLYDTVGIESALPYLAVSLLAHVAVVHLVWQLLRRAGSGPWTATGLATVMLVLGAGYENITWAFQLGFMGAFALGLLATVCCLGDGRPAALAGLLALLAALTFAGVALPFVVSSVVLLAVRRRWVQAAAYAVVPGLVYGAWYLSWGSEAPAAPHGQPLAGRLAAAPGWAWQLIANGLERLVSLPGTASLLLVGLLVALGLLLRRSHAGRSWTDGWSRRALVCGVLMTNLVVQAGTLAFSRADISDPDTSRYLYFVIALLLPVIGALVGELRSTLARTSGRTAEAGRSAAGTPTSLTVATACVIAYLVAVQALTLVARERQYEEPQLLADVRGLAALVAAEEPTTNASLAVDLDVEAIDEWLREGALDGEGASAQEVLDARALAQVAVSREQSATGVGDLVLAGQPVPLDPGACVTSEPAPAGEAAVVSLEPGTTLGVTNQDPGNLSYQVLDGEDAGSRLVAVPASPHATLWMTATTELTLRIVSETGAEVDVCAPA